MKKNIIIAVLSTLIVVFIILIIVGAVSESKNGDKEYKKAYRETFITECMEGEIGYYEFCACAADELIKRNSPEELNTLSNEVVAGNTPTEFFRVLEKCN
jgi:hypothetical protein